MVADESERQATIRRIAAWTLLAIIAGGILDALAPHMGTWAPLLALVARGLLVGVPLAAVIALAWQSLWRS